MKARFIGGVADGQIREVSGAREYIVPVRPPLTDGMVVPVRKSPAFGQQIYRHQRTASGEHTYVFVEERAA